MTRTKGYRKRNAGKTSVVVVVLLAGILLAVVALTLVIALRGRGAGPGPGPDPGPDPGPQPTTLPAGRTQTRAEMIAEGVKPATPSKAVDTGRIAAAYQVGKTYRTLVNLSLSGRGTAKDWGIVQTANMYYVGEVEMLRHIESNDGQTMVLTMEFPKAGNLSINTTVEGLRLDLGARATGLLELGGRKMGLPPGWTSVASQAVNELAKHPKVKQIATRVAQDRAAKYFVFVDGLQGKKVRVKYENGVGLTAITPIGCSISADGKSLIANMAMASDVYILPDLKCKEGDTWIINGVDMPPMFDPSLKAVPDGQIRVERLKDQRQGDTHMAVIAIRRGTFGLRRWDAGSETVGRWAPRGQMLFSFSDRIVTQADLTGDFEIIKHSTDHILFEARMEVRPQYRVLYSCEILK
jgi:hypothetical protein